MYEQQNPQENPWDNGMYGTGRTEPPKSHGGLIAILLILVIFLSGIVTALGILNIRLSMRARAQQPAELPITFETEPSEEPQPEIQSTVPAPTAQAPATAGNALDIQNSPQSADNLPQGMGLPLQEIYEKNIPSVVSIICQLSGGSSSGTGVILSDLGYIVTNNHVVENALAIRIQLTDERILPAQLVGSDAVSDLAVLQIHADNLVSAEFGDSDSLRVGDAVSAIGDPLGVEFRGTMTNGIVSAINRDVTTNGRTLNLIQTNAALNSGNSGGPLINCYGQVIGINTMKIGAFTDNAGVEGLGFAIPSATVKDIVNQLINQGYVSGRPLLGIQGEALSNFYQHFYRMPAGIYVTQVVPDSPADNVGIEVGDMITAIDDTALRDMESLNTILYAHQAGDAVTLTVYRGGYQSNVTVTLAQAKG